MAKRELRGIAFDAFFCNRTTGECWLVFEVLLSRRGGGDKVAYDRMLVQNKLLVRSVGKAITFCEPEDERRKSEAWLSFGASARERLYAWQNDPL